ncbi:LCCL domain-containing protein [Alisedimentitalea sp. MJ-SS2]|uniref:LCCL domain-containing protein n=1 Tax=Aliisedimentitalea sp. MJ-SS2 TaxID=3049795 RepID=UPI0029107AF2|nr:LCCL domain-containing protein [Alisedimentitalea sp. MJ-SS2]MDU8929192.1 LCCL domain-containing protein [Alisedimentitalea sp. MJ-SS2]
MNTIVKVALGGMFIFGGMPVFAQTNLEQCGRYPVNESSYACECAPGETSGSVWGSGPYTADSDLCRAARHAGVITPKGGQITVARVAGKDAYQGSSQNGVTTSDWGSYQHSVVIKATFAAVPKCVKFDPSLSPLSCSCVPNEKRSGSVWGSSPYTTDSDICTAAQHAGLIGVEGGTVTVLALDGLGAYAGSEHNGVTTADWGEYGQSYVFDWNRD